MTVILLKDHGVNPVFSRCTIVKLVTEAGTRSKDTYFSIANMRYGIVT